MFNIMLNSEEEKQKRILSKQKRALKEEGLTVENVDMQIELLFKTNPSAMFIHNAKSAIIHQPKRRKAFLAQKVAEAIIAYDPGLKSLREELRGWDKEQKFFFDTLMNSDLTKQKIKALGLLIAHEAKKDSVAVRQVYEIAMMSYQKASGWGNTDREDAICKAIEQFDYIKGGESKAAELKQKLEAFLQIENIKSSKNIVSLKMYKALNEIMIHFRDKNSELSELAQRCVFRCWQIM